MAAILLAGCGSSSPKTTSSAHAPAKSASHVPSGAPQALRGVHGRVLLAGELALQVKAGSGTGATTFAVATIPGAHGFGGSNSESSSINVAFTKGAYYYLVGAGWPSGMSSPPTRAAVIAAALHLYDRVQA